MAWQYLEYKFPVTSIFDKHLMWLSDNTNIYFAMKANDDDDWSYFAGNASHNLGTGSLLTSYSTSESSAQTNYLTTSKDSNNKVIAILPSSIQAKYVRMYIDDTISTTIYEWKASINITADEVITGELIITDDISDTPLLRVLEGGNDVINLGNFTDNTYGLIGYDGSGNTIFELSNDNLIIGSWTIEENSLYNLDSGTPDTNPDTGITLEPVGGSDNKSIIKIYDGTTLTVALGNYDTDKFGLYVIDGILGSWTVDETSLYLLDSGTPDTDPNTGITLETEGGTDSKAVIRIYDGTDMNAALGNYADGKYGVYAIEGSVGTWEIGSETLSSISEVIVLDATNETITVGDIASDGIQISTDGIAAYGGGVKKGEWLVNSNFWLGTSGGDKKIEWNPDTDTFYIRGNAAFDTLVFQEVFTTKGSFVVAKSGADLYESTTATGTTFTVKVAKSISGGAPFVNSDVCKIDNGVNSTWFTVGTGSDQSDYWQYTATYQSGSNSATYREGVSIVDYGQSGDGWHLLTVDQSNSPRYSIYTHAGSPWSANTELMRYGNLNGFLDYSSTLYGFAVGETNKYLKYDPTNGLRIKGSITITGGSGVANLSDAGDLARGNDLDDVSDENTTYKKTTQNEKTGASRAYSGLDSSNNLITSVIPTTNTSPSGAGLYLGADYLGYYDSTMVTSI